MTKTIFKSDFFSCLVIEQAATTKEMQKKDPSLCKANLGRDTARRGSRFFLFFALYIQQPNSALRFLSKAWGFSGLFPHYCPYKQHCCVFLTLTRYLVSLWKRRIKCSVVPAGHYSSRREVNCTVSSTWILVDLLLLQQVLPTCKGLSDARLMSQNHLITRL